MPEPPKQDNRPFGRILIQMRDDYPLASILARASPGSLKVSLETTPLGLGNTRRILSKANYQLTDDESISASIQLADRNEN